MSKAYDAITNRVNNKPSNGLDPRGLNVINLEATRAARTAAASRPQVHRFTIGNDTLIVEASPGGELRAYSERWLRRTFHPAVNALPFVERDDAGKVTSFWAPDPDARHGDGRKWGAALFSALAADGCDGRPLEQVFEALIEDGIRRRLKGGKRSRATLTPVTDGLLRGFGEAVAAAIAGQPMKGGAA